MLTPGGSAQTVSRRSFIQLAVAMAGAAAWGLAAAPATGLAALLPTGVVGRALSTVGGLA
jgi:hypothetical protein